MAQIPLPEGLEPVAAAFAAAGTPLYLVGGAVRNALLRQPFEDLDAAGGAPFDAAVRIAASAGARAQVRDDRMGTVEIRSGALTVEYTPFRRESYARGGRHRPEEVVFTPRLEEDALRRDFTVNALYADALTGEVVDPLHGLDHLERRVLQSCRSGEITLSSDGVRILRMVRFACQLGFAIHPDLYRSARAHGRNLADIAAERKGAELVKILLSDARCPSLSGRLPQAAHLRGLELLLDLGVMDLLLPELLEGEGMEQPGRYHRYPVLQHNLMVCAAMPARLHLRLAGLLHDVAKPRCFRLTGGKMYGHDLLGAAMAEEMLLRLRLERRTIDAVCPLIERHMFDLDGSARESTCRKRFARWGFAFTEDLIALRRGDIIGSGMNGSQETADRWERILGEMRAQGAVDSMDQLAVTGREIMEAAGIGPGPAVGRLKELLFERAAVNPAINTRERLMREAANLYRSFPRG